MMRDNRGFIAISVIYSFLLVFLLLMVVVLNSYFNNKTSFDMYKENIKETAATKYDDNTLVNIIKKAESLTNKNPSGVRNEDGVYRYFGKTPDNYVCFGTYDKNTCLDEKISYLFRIVGAFKESIVSENGGNGYVAKIVSAYFWAPRQYASDRNIWANSELKDSLNEEYLDELFKNSDFNQKMIIDAKWYVAKQPELSLTAKEAYQKEMASEDIVIAKVGMLSASDWGFASYFSDSGCPGNSKMDDYRENDCYVYNWIAKDDMDKTAFKTNEGFWFLDNYSDGDVLHAWAFKGGYKGNRPLKSYIVTTYRYVYPTMYIDNEVRVISGTGSRIDPYIIDIPD